MAFPRNPYHYLVKHYQDGQLKRGRVNDPELDARPALEVFGNQLSALAAAPQDLLTAWHWLASGNEGAGFDLVFNSIRNSPRPTEAEARKAIETCLTGAACRTRARQVVQDSDRQGWELAYALAWLSVAGGNSVLPPWVHPRRIEQFIGNDVIHTFVSPLHRPALNGPKSTTHEYLSFPLLLSPSNGGMLECVTSAWSRCNPEPHVLGVG